METRKLENTELIAEIEKCQRYYLNETKCCPIIGTVFDVQNPPYRLDCCDQEVTLEAIMFFQVFEHKNEKTKVRSKICPFCHTPIEYITLDLTLLLWLNFESWSLDILNQNKSEICALEEDKREIDNFLLEFSKECRRISQSHPLILKVQEVIDYTRTFIKV
jgi:hypothetical protein